MSVDKDYTKEDITNLAHAMGWELKDTVVEKGKPTVKLWWEGEDIIRAPENWNPFTLPNHDYQVLDHFRRVEGVHHDRFRELLDPIVSDPNRTLYYYQIGDWARAAREAIA